MIFFNDTATTEIYTLSLHDALPISETQRDLLRRLSPIHKLDRVRTPLMIQHGANDTNVPLIDRKSTRLNSSHANISYAVFCLKKKFYTPLPFFYLSFLPFSCSCPFS